MTAREMFNELGFEYEEIKTAYDELVYIILFNSDMFVKFKIDDKLVIVSHREDKSYAMISCEKLKAIIKQCEELGWL